MLKWFKLITHLNILKHVIFLYKKGRKIWDYIILWLKKGTEPRIAFKLLKI